MVCLGQPRRSWRGLLGDALTRRVACVLVKTGCSLPRSLRDLLQKATWLDVLCLAASHFAWQPHFSELFVRTPPRRRDAALENCIARTLWRRA